MKKQNCTCHYCTINLVESEMGWRRDGHIHVDQRGRYGGGDDCCGDGVKTGTKSENFAGTECLWNCGVYIFMLPV